LIQLTDSQIKNLTDLIENTRGFDENRIYTLIEKNEIEFYSEDGNYHIKCNLVENTYSELADFLIYAKVGRQLEQVPDDHTKYLLAVLFTNATAKLYHADRKQYSQSTIVFNLDLNNLTFYSNYQNMSLNNKCIIKRKENTY
jgi:hypothetical protein